MSHVSIHRFQGGPGLESVITKENSKMAYEGFKRLLVKAGQTFTYDVTGEEQAIVLQSGDFEVTVEYKGRKVIDGAKGFRADVYNSLPTAVYAPPSSKVTVSSEKGMEARIFTAYCDEGNTPYFLTPDKVEEGEPGYGNYQRKYRHIFGAPGKVNDQVTCRLIVGESVSREGGWIGYPAHRHDYNRGDECVLDEIFSFQVTSYGSIAGLIQYEFDLDDANNKLWDELTVIESNEFAMGLPEGYHTLQALPGSICYLLWGLAGPEKVYKLRFDERYAWLKKWR